MKDEADGLINLSIGVVVAIISIVEVVGHVLNGDSLLVVPQLTNLDRIDGIKTATMVGGAKSSFDAVHLLLKQGKKVHWIIREDGAGPLA